MSASPEKGDWNPGTYQRFRGLRLRPAMDLLQAVGEIPTGPIVDLGCGSGSVGPALRGFDRPLIGVDASPAMLAEAHGTGVYDTLIEGDIAQWVPEIPPALIYSNAALHWVPDHQTVFKRLSGVLAPGGVLAVQMPHQNNAPSHRVWRSLADELFHGAVDTKNGPSILLAAQYHHLLSTLGAVSIWETEYYQVLDACDDAHPVRRFTEATFARPILAQLSDVDQQVLISAYEDVMEKAYPRSADGTVLFPFRRLFVVLKTEA